MITTASAAASFASTRTRRAGSAGFAWSTMKASRFIAPDDEHLVLGRFVPGFRP